MTLTPTIRFNTDGAQAVQKTPRLQGAGKGQLEGFTYTIKSLPAPLLLQPEPKKKAAALPGGTSG